MDLIILPDILEICLKHGTIEDAHKCFFVSLKFLAVKAFPDILAEEMFTNGLDLIDNPIMTKAQFVKNTEIRLLRLSLQRSGHEVGVEEIVSVLDECVAVDIVRGGEQQVETVDLNSRIII